METLAARIDRAGPLETGEAVILAARLARALEAPHDRGVAHGAVSPESVLVEREDLLTAVLRASSRCTPSVHHQSPERLAGGGASVEDDIWALGSTLYVALTGTVPFPGTNAQQVADRIHQGSIAPLAVFDAGDDDLQDLLEGIFHPRPDDRTRSTVRVRKSLTRWLAKRGIAPGPALAIGAAESKPEVDLSSIPPPPRLPDMEDRPTIPRVGSAASVLYTFADEDTTLPRDTGPDSLAPPSHGKPSDAPLSSRLPPTSELLARAKAAPSRAPASGPPGVLKPAELATRLRLPSIPPSGPRLNPPRAVLDRIAKASEPPPADKPFAPPDDAPSEVRPDSKKLLDLSVTPPPADVSVASAEPSIGNEPSDTEARPASSRKPPPLPIEPPSSSRTPPPLPSESVAPPSSRRPPPLPTESAPTSSRRPPPLPIESGPPPSSRRPAPLPIESSPPPVEPARPLPDEVDASADGAVVAAGVVDEAVSGAASKVEKPSKRAKRGTRDRDAKSVEPSAAAASVPSSPAPPPGPKKSVVLPFVVVAAVAGAAVIAYEVFATSPQIPPSAASADASTSAKTARPTESSSATPTSSNATTAPTISSATAKPSASESAHAPPPPLDASRCIAKLFPPDSFAEGAEPKLDFVCRETDPRTGAERAHEALVIAGMGRTVSDGMREWAVMGWYELAAFAALRGRCCPDASDLALPPSPGTCSSMQDALNAVAKGARPGASDTDQKDALAGFKKSLSCMLKSGKSKPFGSYPKPGGGEDTAFSKTYQRTRQPD